MELLFVGYLLGGLTSIIFVGIGVCFGRCDKGQLNADSDVRTDAPNRDRNRCWNKLLHKQS